MWASPEKEIPMARKGNGIAQRLNGKTVDASDTKYAEDYCAFYPLSGQKAQ